MSANSLDVHQTIYLSNDSQIMYARLKEALDPIILQTALYMSGHFNDSLLDDLESQKQVAIENHTSPQRITELIKQGKLKTYTKHCLIRKSEAKAVIEATRRKSRRGKHPKAPKAK